WAETQNNLGNAYSERIRGNRADNIEKAITAFENAFTISGAEALLQQRILGYPNLGYFHPMLPNAVILCNLGGTYSQRIEGNKENNIKMAIRVYENALKILANVDFPSFWAAIQRNLSMAYLERIDGNKEKNIEDAIEFCRQALTIFTQESYPKDWADTQYSLGFAYSDRIRGNRAENLKAAIIHYHNALTIRTKENDPLNCLQTARNLADLHYNEKQWQPATEAYNIAIEAV
ncbi:MAG: tetratricopeptide repeat protein, partial [Dolichospermum sp.]